MEYFYVFIPNFNVYRIINEILRDLMASLAIINTRLSGADRFNALRTPFSTDYIASLPLQNLKYLDPSH